MSAQIWRFSWHANIVPHTLVNILVAAGADVILERFVGLHTADFNIAVQTIPN